MQTRQACWACAGGWVLAAQAAAQQAPELQLPSCVAGSPPLSMPAATARASLDGGDRKRFHDAAQARYPLYQRGGWAPAEVLLLQRGAQWLYVTLSPRDDKATCFSAVFAADRFDFTERWLAKYRPRAGPADD